MHSPGEFRWGRVKLACRRVSGPSADRADCGHGALCLERKMLPRGQPFRLGILAVLSDFALTFPLSLFFCLLRRGRPGVAIGMGAKPIPGAAYDRFWGGNLRLPI